MENDEQKQILPPGFRFYPTEEELITYYLHQKLHALRPDLDRVIPSIDIYKFEPCRLPGLAGEVCNGETEQWFFFSPRQEREARGGRPNRTTGSGYWKATGSPTYVYSSENNKVIGMKKTMVFYKGKAPTGRKTKWKMNEYKAIKFLHQCFLNHPSTSSISTIPELRNELSLCRVYITSGCARAFDRRPSGRLLMPNTNSNAIPKDDLEQANRIDGCCLQNNGKNKQVKILMEKSNSASTDDDSSNSGVNYNGTHGDAHALDHPANCSGTQIADDMETLWNLEQIIWL